ncbi:RadC family protein [Lachnoclostridium sp. Marseille-P6806]|uniref:RadC family protein n=1 Tax=Lachnoclostridium sp. Marseille-P6806 TaxID=2364793 RepID=UPI0010312E4B|nr:DNA repair protein RadC [Lachnoclostridium sp. Marseille-P6806]
MNNIQEQPYERFLRCGCRSLTDAELIAVILRTGTREHSAVEIARTILTGGVPSAEPDLSVLYELTLEDLMKIRGIGEVKAIKLLCLAELSKRLSQAKVQRELCFSSPESVYGYYREQFRHEKQERLILLLLDQRLSLIREETVSVGTVNTTLISTREVCVRALRRGAVNILLMHNHPSGDPAPSRQDIEVTERMAEACRILEIELLDHIIIGDGYTSFRESGYLV